MRWLAAALLVSLGALLIPWPGRPRSVPARAGAPAARRLSAAPDSPPALPALAPGAPNPAPAPAGLDRHFRYLLAARLPTGAIAMTPQHLLINPYFANLAARALLTRPGHLGAVEAWLDWYLANLNPDGTIDDFRVVAGQEVPTGRYDSADSYAATYLSLVAAYRRAGGDPEWVRASRAGLEQVAGVLAALTDAGDGLTWARPRYPLKLLMDNAEVWAGWQDWADLLLELGDPAGAAAARQRAARLQASLARFRADDRYAWALGPLGLRREANPARFYPDAVAQFFPFALGATADPQGYHRFARAHPAWTELASDHFPWLFAAYAAGRAGDREAVAAALAAAGRRYPDLRPPWYVAESAWLIRTAAGDWAPAPAPP